MLQPERELLNTTCSHGRIIVTDTKVIIRTAHGFRREEQSIPRATITGVDCMMKLVSAEITIHRAGGDSITVKTLTKQAAGEIQRLLS